MAQSSFAAILNSAVAVGDYQSSPVFSTASLVSIPVTAATPQIQLQKDSVFNDENGDGVAQAGETISYNFTVTNTGNVTLTNVTVTDPGITLMGGPIASLAPAGVDSTTIHGSYTIVLADINAGSKSNSASVSGLTPSSVTVTDQSDSTNPGDDTGANNDATITPIPKAVIDAVNDDFTASPVNGLAGGSTPTVYANDTLNAASFAAAAVQGSITNNGGIAGLAMASNGSLTIPAGTSAGTYTVLYQICETANPTNCDIAQVANLVITSATINAVDDNFSASPVNGLTGGVTTTVYGNDTLNGSPFVPATVTPTITANGGLTGASINPADGTISIPAGTPAGSYVVTYQICETAVPLNCDTGNATVVVSPAAIVANDDNFASSPVNGLTGGNTATVFTNDTLNGASFAAAAVTVSVTNNGGLTGAAINAAGVISVPANTPAGSYPITYHLCEVLNPTNCDNAVATVVVAPPAIVANDDNFSAAPINGMTGGTTATAFTNDTLNGASFVPSAVTASISSNGGLTGVSINANGTITVPANRPAGTYAVGYNICEVLNPSNCDTAIATIVVTAAAIVANNDNFSASPVNGLTGGNTATVYTNDTLNGAAFAPASVTPSVTNNGGLTGLGINPDGTLAVPAATPAGTYTVTYQICEVLNPLNCDTATVSVAVAAAAIVANNDNFLGSPVAGSSGGNTATVFTNDTLNGVAFSPGAVTPTITNDGGLTGAGINPDGTISVPAGTPAGSYSITYQICEVLNTSNCDTAVASVAVSSATINAVDDNFSASPINGTNGGTTTTVFVNDTLNGSAFVPAAVNTSLTNNGGLTGAGINGNGIITVPVNTPAGSYTLTYLICEVLNPTNCDAANVTVVVTAAPIIANDDNFSASPIVGSAGGTTSSVFVNDTLNGGSINPSDVTPSITNNGGLAGVTINPDGTITVPPGRPAGSYVITYEICQVLNPLNCDTASVTVNVSAAAIVANNDNFTGAPVGGLAGGTTASVFTNDTLNGAAFASSAVTASVTLNGGLSGVSINSDGTLNVPAGSPAGSYNVTYQICELLNPLNCDTAVATVAVSSATINAVNDDFSASPVNGLGGGSTATVFTNDLLNGAPFASSAVNGSIFNNGGLTGATINSAGIITVPANTPAGTYPVTYRICEVLNGTNCDAAVATIVVTAAPILAQNDNFSASPINGLTGGTTATVYTNDTLNGVAIVPSAITSSITNTGGLTGVSINSSGVLSVPANRPAGTYTVTYEICENLNPSNCDTADVTVVVTAAPIVANNDNLASSPVNGLGGGSTATVYANDTLNGVAFAPAEVTPSITGDGGLTGVSINPADGTITVPAGSTAGTYTVTYQICEVLNPTNCDTATAQVVVTASTIVADNDNFTGTPIPFATGGSTVTVFTNDTLNGAAFVPSAVTVTLTSDAGTGATIASTGIITVPSGVAPGPYTLSYTICEVLNSANCDSANVLIQVTASAIVANNDNFTPAPVSGFSGGTTATVLTNDTLNGVGASALTVTASLVSNGGLTGVQVNADGTITVPPNTPAGSYSVGYEICEIANSGNCATAVAVVAVSAPPILANDDNFTGSPVNGLTGGPTTAVFVNDTINGIPFAPGSVAATITNNGGIAGVTINAAGIISVPANRPAGTYAVTYQICQTINTSNCDTAIATVVVSAAAIVANDDNFSAAPIGGAGGGDTPTVFSNDTLNGSPFAQAAVTSLITDEGGLTGVTINTNGTLHVLPGSAAGSYNVTYQICEVLNTGNCDTAVATVVVNAATIDAVNDDFTATPVNALSGGSTPTVFTNDTLNGVSFLTSAVTVSISSDGGLAGVSINSSGIITVPGNRPVGTYSVGYTVCEVLNSTNCDTAVATVVVAPAPIIANDDDFSGTPFALGVAGATPTVFTNDTLNGITATAATVTPSITNPGGLTGATMNPNGTISVPATAPAGTYNVTYQICQTTLSTNCDTAVATIVVNGSIAASDDNFTGTAIGGTAGGSTPSVYTNDTINGSPFATSAVVPSISNDGGLAGVTINPAGQIVVPAGSAPGLYSITYQICQVTNPANCDTAVASIQVAPAVGTVIGTVYVDENGNGTYDPGDTPAGAGYIVELIDSGTSTVVGSATTVANGGYSITAPIGSGYIIQFKSPTGTLIGGQPNVTITETTVVDVNLPLDPSGIVYNSVTRQPVAGVAVSLLDASNNPLPGICFVNPSQATQVTGADGAYRFDLLPGANAACPVGETRYTLSISNPAAFSPGFSTTLPPQAGALEGTACPVDPNPGSACVVTPSGSVPTGTPVTYYTAFLLQQGDGDIIHNHIPIDPIAVPGAGFTKKALILQAKRGERIPYVIEANSVAVNPATITDVLPVGIAFVPGTATVNGSAVTPAVSGNTLTFSGLAPSATGSIKVEYVATVTLVATTGPKVNKASITDPATGAVLGTAQATITVMTDHVFDCGDVIGKVFDDKNRDGYQDKGETGLPGVRLVTVKGVQITTDKDGLFHVPCAELPDAAIGSNFILKLDTRTLPTGYRVTTENPRIVRLTAGKATKLNFGASNGRVVKFDVTGDAFVTNSTSLKPEWKSAVDKLVDVLAADKSTLRLTYVAKTDGSKLAADRLSDLEKMIIEKWKASGTKYQLPIEKRLVSKTKKAAP